MLVTEKMAKTGRMNLERKLETLNMLLKARGEPELKLVEKEVAE